MDHENAFMCDSDTMTSSIDNQDMPFVLFTHI